MSLFRPLQPCQAANSTVGLNFSVWGNREPRGWGYCILPGSCCMKASAPPKKDDIYGMGRGLSTGILAAVPSALSPKPQTPVSPHRTLVYSALSPLEPRVNVCRRDFMGCPFKRAPVFLADCCLSLEDRIPTDFHSQMFCGSLF